ncbi:tyrosine kinase, putative [Bodo saltans]|uniref:Tyrosine kinase, putative n=1 Tax=Bodo saltans TaxID=75058 RepID=A0A0S4JF03_BODSA|nr:tyrosine kinase, putative [Bodo saltans]|eukprot:CUG89038.1 tyrosine kinase, putative [Bodo saltans]
MIMNAHCPSIPPLQYIVATDRVSVDAVAPLCGGCGEDVLFSGVLTTTGQPDRAVLVKRYVGTDAAAIARHEVALLLHIAHRNVISVVGLVDVNPRESLVLLEEHDRANGGDITLLTRTAVDDLRTRLGTAAFGRQVLQWGLDVAAGLAHLHAKEMRHLNFCTSNTILSGGIAKVNAVGVAQRLSIASPPQALQDSASSYVYGLGAFLHELLTGDSLFDAFPNDVQPSLEPDALDMSDVTLSGPTAGVLALTRQLLHRDPWRRGTLDTAMQRMQELLDAAANATDQQPPPVLSVGLCPWTPGWLDTVDPQPSLLEALLCLIRCTVLSDHRTEWRESRKLMAWYQRTANATTASLPQFSVGSQQWVDACAIRLYTCVESPVDSVINNMLTQRNVAANDVKCIAPIARRVIGAVQRLGVPYIGNACLVLHADTLLVQELYANYKDHFAVGKQVNVPQIARVTTDADQMQSLAQGTRPVIVLRCCNMSAFDVSVYSAHKCTEPTVLATPPSCVVVISAPLLSRRAVIVDVILDITTSASYVSGDLVQHATAAGFLHQTEPTHHIISQAPLFVSPQRRKANPRKVISASSASVVVDAVVRMSHDATTPNGVHCLSMAIVHVTSDADASGRAAFATAVTVDAIVRMSHHATTPNAVHWLSAAIAHVLCDADASGKAAFATTSLMDAIERMSDHASTPNAIRWLCNAMSHLLEETDAFALEATALLSSFLRLTRFVTSNTVICFLKAICSFTSDTVIFTSSKRDETKRISIANVIDSMFHVSKHVTTPNAVSWLSRAICNMAKAKVPKLNPKDLLASSTTTSIGGVETKFAVARLSTYATTPDAVLWLSTAICNILSGAHPPVKAAFATPAVADAVARMSYHAKTPDTVRWLSTAMQKITSSINGTLRTVFITTDIVDAFVRMSAYATTPDAVCWLSAAIGKIVNGIDASTKSIFATNAVVEAVATMACHATTPDAVHYLSASIVHITEGANVSAKAMFAVTAIADAVVMMSHHATTPDTVLWLSSALGSIASKIDAPLRTVFLTTSIVNAVVRMARHATTPDAVRYLSSAIVRITSGVDASTKAGMFDNVVAFDNVVEAFATMSHHATTADAVGSLSSAIEKITTGTDASKAPMFATLRAIVEAVARISHHATTPDAVRSLSAVIVGMTEGANASAKALFGTTDLMEAIARLLKHAPTVEVARMLTAAIDRIVQEIDVPLRTALVTTNIVDAVVQLTIRATTPNDVRSLSAAIVAITQGTDATVETVTATTAVVDAVAQFSNHAKGLDAVNHNSMNKIDGSLHSVFLTC